MRRHLAAGLEDNPRFRAESLTFVGSIAAVVDSGPKILTAKQFYLASNVVPWVKPLSELPYGMFHWLVTAQLLNRLPRTGQYRRIFRAFYSCKNGRSGTVASPRVTGAPVVRPLLLAVQSSIAEQGKPGIIAVLREREYVCFSPS